MGVEEQFGLVVCKVDENYIVLYEGAYEMLDSILKITEDCLGIDNIFKVKIPDREEYNKKKRYVDVLNGYIDDILDVTL